jgi:ABC-type multidrug transport system fused ATPase/permease subunit
MRLMICRSLRSQIGIVPQSPVLFDDTIMNNVRYAKLSATDEEVYEACRAASVHDQIMGFTDGESDISLEQSSRAG